MNSRRLWVCLGLLAGLLPAGCGEPSDPPMPPGVDVQHYDLTLRLDPETSSFQARAVLDVVHPDTLTALPLMLAGMVVDSVRVNGVIITPTHRSDRIRVPIQAGRRSSRLDVFYHGAPKKGVYRARHEGQPVLFTDSWPDEGSGWLPGMHHPSDPATFALSLTLPQGYEAVASGRLLALDTLGTDVRYRWQLDVPVPTYAFAFAVGDFSLVETAVADTLPVRYYLLAGDSARVGQLERAPEALAFFSEVLGPYPFAQYASVQVPIKYAGMENASASFLQAALFRTGEAEEVQIHEIAHQWFGNRVPIADWPHLWLSEGTATYLTTLFYEYADGLDAARRQWVAMADIPPFRRRGHGVLVDRSPRSPLAYLTWLPYDKGGSVLHVLRRKLGDRVFFAALRATYQRFAGRPLSTSAFQVMLEEEAGRDLSAFFRYWVYGNDLPTLTTMWNPETRALAWEIAGDEGTLEGVPFELQVRQGERLRYVEVGEGGVVLPDWDKGRPEVRPVGVLMQVEGSVSIR